MKRILIALFLCLFAFKASAWNPMVVCSGAPSYILEESFEGDEYDNVVCGTPPCYTEIAGTPNGNADATSFGMIGVYCLHLDNGEYLSLFHPDTEGQWNYYLFKFRHTASNADVAIAYIRNVTPAILGTITLKDADNKLYALAAGGAESAAAATAIADDTSTWVKVKAFDGTSSDTQTCVSVWGGAAWDAYVCSTNGTEYSNIDSIRYGNPNDAAAEEHFYDGLKVSGVVDFVNNPTTY